MESEIARLQQRVAQLEMLAEHLRARDLEHLPMPPQILEVSLNGTTGTVLDWDPNASQYVNAQFADALTVASPGGSFAIWRPQANRWELLAAGGGSTVKKIRFALAQALSGQDHVDNCTVVVDWYSNAGASKVTVYNEDGWVSDAGALGLAEWNPAEQKWVITLLPCATGNS